MNYQASGDRCAIDASIYRALEPVGINEAQFMNYLRQLGCRIEQIDLEGIARALVGRALYQPSAHWSAAPEIVDCSSYVGWAYGRLGILLPRYTLEIIEIGQPILLRNIRPGDILLTRGDTPFYLCDPREGVGHCGLWTNAGTVLHATNGNHQSVVESNLIEFLAGDLKHVRRVIPADYPVKTIICPPELEIRSSKQLLCEILKRL